MGVARTANSLSLSLSSVQLQDEGSYACSAVDAAGSNDTVTTMLRVDGKPLLVIELYVVIKCSTPSLSTTTDHSLLYEQRLLLDLILDSYHIDPPESAIH